MKVQESSPAYEVLAQSVSTDNWTLVPLKELGKWSGGGTPSKSKPDYWEGGTIPWVSPKDMKTDHIVDSEDHITKAAVEESTAKLISAGSVLIVTRSGILSHTLPVAVTTVPVTVNQDLKALTPREGVLPEYVAWALRCFAREILNTCSKQGTTVSSIETAALHRFEIPVAPLDQQKRIVAEIEKQFSRLDEAVANLKRVKANLKRYKAAVLKAAVEGQIFFPGEEAAGWRWTQIGEVAQVISGLTKHPKRDALPRKLPYLRVANVYADELRLGEMHQIGVAESEEEKLLLRPGDMLVVEGNGSPDQIGRVALWNGAISNCVHQNHLIKVRFGADVLPKWALTWLLSPGGRREIELVSSSTSGLHTLSTGKVSRLPIPIPPMQTQSCLLAEVERRLSIVRGAELEVNTGLARAARLRTAILNVAFGEASKQACGPGDSDG